MNGVRQYKVSELLFKTEIEHSNSQRNVFEENKTNLMHKIKHCSSNISSYQTRSSSASTNCIKKQIQLKISQNVKHPDFSFYLISAKNKSITAKNRDKLYHNNSLPLLPIVSINKKSNERYFNIDTDDENKEKYENYENEYKDSIFRKLKKQYKFVKSKTNKVDLIFKLSCIAKHKEEKKIKIRYPFFIKRTIKKI